MIDFGVCPPVGGFLRASTYTDPDHTRRWGDAAGMEAAPSLYSGSITGLFAELDQAGVARAVVRGHAMGARPSDKSGLPPLVFENDELRALVAEFPDRFIAMPTIPGEQIARARELIPALAADPAFRGLALHPHSWPVPVDAADRRVMYPAYEACVEHDIPVLLTIGGNAGPNLGFNVPTVVDQVAADFPQLKVIVAHGDWPYVLDILHVAFRRENVWLSPDMYLFGMPGWRDYVDAANGFLQDRFLYASMHPYVPVTGAVAWCREHLSPVALEKVMRLNAERVLGLAPRSGSS